MINSVTFGSVNKVPVNNTNNVSALNISAPAIPADSFENSNAAQQIEQPKKTQNKKFSPEIAAGAMATGGMWFCGMLAFDRIMNKICPSLFKSTLKTSLAMNALFGLAMGAIAYFKNLKNS